MTGEGSTGAGGEGRKRRPRYRGTHPRRFHERYKELDPSRYPETEAKVLAQGRTPAGSHRPIMVREVLEALAPRPGEIAVDATVGHGGHARALLPLLVPGGRLIALDADPIELPRTEAQLRGEGWGPEALACVHSNFAGLPKVLAALGVAGADLVLADLGCSSMQLDDPRRGFSMKREGPLDMRMNPGKGASAAAWLARVSASRLADALRDHADEPDADPLAHAILAARERSPIETTARLARIVREASHALSRARGARDAGAGADLAVRRVFQAIRIAVNDELSALDALLRVLPDLLRSGGRVAILAFHSGEDRRVKRAFEGGRAAGIFARISEEVIRPSAAEAAANPRAAPARLRWALRA